MPAVTLVDQRRLARAAWPTELARPGPVAVQFVFTTCPAVCPVADRRRWPRPAPAARSCAALSITIDPEHDTPARLRAYAASFGAGRGWRFLTGRGEDLLAVQQAFDAYRGDKMRHQPPPSCARRPGGPWVRLDGFPPAPAELARLAEARGGPAATRPLRSPAASAWPRGMRSPASAPALGASRSPIAGDPGDPAAADLPRGPPPLRPTARGPAGRRRPCHGPRRRLRRLPSPQRLRRRRGHRRGAAGHRAGALRRAAAADGPPLPRRSSRRSWRRSRGAGCGPSACAPALHGRHPRRRAARGTRPRRPDARPADAPLPPERRRRRAPAAYLETLAAHPPPGVEPGRIHFATVVTPGADPVRRAAWLDVATAYVRWRNARRARPGAAGRLDARRRRGPDRPPPRVGAPRLGAVGAGGRVGSAARGAPSTRSRSSRCSAASARGSWRAIHDVLRAARDALPLPGHRPARARPTRRLRALPVRRAGSGRGGAGPAPARGQGRPIRDRRDRIRASGHRSTASS